MSIRCDSLTDLSIKNDTLLKRRIIRAKLTLTVFMRHGQNILSVPPQSLFKYDEYSHAIQLPAI
jgi:hypothetical protein